ncbi:TetR/AcrR family transcriptional regulator [Neisseriaceae bacterium CLB008]|nr:TetR/AcrR family transcriptional regulator [Neisseriaceae bacterium]
MAKEVKQNTYNKIVDASLDLFNEQGERNISTNHIAAHLSISPGNLYYHFRNKDEIILQLFKRYRQDTLQYLKEYQAPSSTDSVWNFVHNVFDVMWRYRFLFADTNTLLARSDELAQEYHEFTETEVTPAIAKQCQVLIDCGFISIDEASLKRCATNIWLISKYWFVFESSAQQQQPLDEQAKFRGIKQVMSIVQPYVTDEYKVAYEAIINREDI